LIDACSKKEEIMRRLVSIILILGILFAFISPSPANAASPKWVIPTISIVSVTKDTSVTVQTHNFPASDTFRVLMNYMGTKGKNGIQVATINSGAGGSFSQTFAIPDALKGQYQIAIRLESTTGSGYYAFNWFYNNKSGGTGGGGTGSPSGYYGYPTFSITAVQRNQTVTIKTYNLTPNDSFNVTMGPMGTRGKNGYYVTTVSSGAGGTQTLTFTIPAALSGSYQISIRLQSPTSGFFAYNWFYNNTYP
jgi:hypothetical protein